MKKIIDRDLTSWSRADVEMVPCSRVHSCRLASDADLSNLALSLHCCAPMVHLLKRVVEPIVRIEPRCRFKNARYSVEYPLTITPDLR